jgi:hypothetical protein
MGKQAPSSDCRNDCRAYLTIPDLTPSTSRVHGAGKGPPVYSPAAKWDRDNALSHDRLRVFEQVADVDDPHAGARGNA